jgi:hypothetical protein
VPAEIEVVFVNPGLVGENITACHTVYVIQMPGKGRKGK